VTEEEVFARIKSSIASVWALELLLLLRRTSPQLWTYDELVVELRSSRTVVEFASATLLRAGLVAQVRGEGITYEPAGYAERRFADELQRIYSAKPMRVVRAIMTTPNEKLRIFSDAFRLKG
jgi:hypothetical protein